MMTIRLEDILARYKILKEETIRISQELVAKTKDVHEEEAKKMSHFLTQIKSYSNKLTEIADDSTSIAHDLSYSKKYRELYDQYFLDIKELSLELNKQFQIITNFYTTRYKIKAELTQKTVRINHTMSIPPVGPVNTIRSLLLPNKVLVASISR